MAGSGQQYSSGTRNIRKGVEQGQRVRRVVQTFGDLFQTVREDAGGAAFLGLIAISR